MTIKLPISVRVILNLKKKKKKKKKKKTFFQRNFVLKFGKGLLFAISSNNQCALQFWTKKHKQAK